MDDEAPSEAASADIDYPSAMAADPGHYSTIYENDAIRMVEVNYPPSESSVMHSHPAHCFILVTASEWSMATPDAEPEASTGAAGDFGCSEEPSAHMPTNAGSDAIRLFLFEMKDGMMAGSDAMEGADAVEVDPDHYAVEFENDAVRILRISYAAGEPGVEHGHPANCIVWLQVDDSVEDAAAVGDWACNDAQVHVPGGNANPVELLAIEFKGRSTAQ